MRLLISILTILFTGAIIAVTLMNASETVTIRLWNDEAHEYRDVPLWIVLFIAAFAGFVFTGIIAVLEGVKTRLDNARLTRKVRRLQLELESIRTPSLPLPAEERPASEDEDHELVPG